MAVALAVVLLTGCVQRAYDRVKLGKPLAENWAKGPAEGPYEVASRPGGVRSVQFSQPGLLTNRSGHSAVGVGNHGQALARYMYEYYNHTGLLVVDSHTYTLELEIPEACRSACADPKKVSIHLDSLLDKKWDAVQEQDFTTAVRSASGAYRADIPSSWALHTAGALAVLESENSMAKDFRKLLYWRAEQLAGRDVMNGDDWSGKLGDASWTVRMVQPGRLRVTREITQVVTIFHLLFLVFAFG